MFCGVLSLLPPPSPSRPRCPYEALSRQFIASLCIFTLCLSYVLTCPVLLWCCVLPLLLPPLRPRYLDEALARQFTTAVRVGKKSKEAGKSIKEVRAHASRSYSILCHVCMNRQDRIASTAVFWSLLWLLSMGLIPASLSACKSLALLC